MKTLPPSWIKLKDKQLSFADALLNKPKPEDIFVERFLNELKNIKYLRYRANYAKIKKIEQLGMYEELSTVLDAGARLLTDLSKKTVKYHHKTENDFLSDVFVERITWAPTESLTYKDLKESHEHAKNRIVGMLLANKDILKRSKRDSRLLLEAFDRSHIILHRLNVI